MSGSWRRSGGVWETLAADLQYSIIHMVPHTCTHVPVTGTRHDKVPKCACNSPVAATLVGYRLVGARSTRSSWRAPSWTHWSDKAWPRRCAAPAPCRSPATCHVRVLLDRPDRRDEVLQLAQTGRWALTPECVQCLQATPDTLALACCRHLVAQGQAEHMQQQYLIASIVESVK